MTAVSLETIVARALAEVGAPLAVAGKAVGRERTTVWSPGERGFGVREYASGKRVYVVQARMDGRMRTVTIGSAAVLSRTKALAVARRVQALALVGGNPAEDRLRVRSAPSWTDFVEEYWTRCAPSWKPSTRKQNDGRRRNYIAPAFAGRFVDEIAYADVSPWFAKLTKQSGPGGANSVAEIVRSMFFRAEDWGYRPINSNPVSELTFNRKRKCERFLDADELARLGRVLSELRTTQPAHADAITLLALTGCRAGEVLSLQWPDIHGRRIRLRDSKSGPRTVWLGEEAKAVLDRIERRKGVSPVLWDLKRRAPVTGLHRFWAKVQEGAGLSGVRMHDLRHTFASHAAIGSENLITIGRLLGHQGTASTTIYAHMDDASVLTAAENVGAKLASLLDCSISTMTPIRPESRVLDIAT